MNFKNLNSKYSLLLIVAAVLFLALFSPIEETDTALKTDTGSVAILTKQAEQHILYGDYKGGGHLYGVGKPCKSEFPTDWNAKQVITTVMAQAANDNVNWRIEDNGYQVSEKTHNNVRVRVVMDDDRSHIITAYPINQPRNPCKNK